MIKHELLVPAGDMECLKQAIANGADAVYLGLNNFSARKFAKNFTNEEMQSAVRLAHLYGVKLYCTMNTVVKNKEVSAFLGEVEFLHRIGIDAIIMQDFGMICLCREMFPNLEIHASTQANTSCKETAQMYYDLGVKRVVFSRELSLEEIEKIDVPIEKEVFIHGALCVSYSGCCLMSAMIGDRSANRGECSSCCRLPYTLYRGQRKVIENKYLLSMKELNTSTRFKELMNSNITSFKIEGRMKSPEYVGYITRMYHKLMTNGGVDNKLEEANNKLKILYNRGFTLGNLFKTPAKELINISNPNHIGLEIGKVVSITKEKIGIKLDEDLHQEDAIRFLNTNKGFIVNYLYDKDHKLINEVKKGNICYVDNKCNLEVEDTVCKTGSYLLNTELKKLPARVVAVTFRVTAKIGQPLTIELSDGVNKLIKKGKIVEEAKTQSLDADRIRTQIEKLGDTPYRSASTVVDVDKNIFIGIKDINELRRDIIMELTMLRMNSKKEVLVRQGGLLLPHIKELPRVLTAEVMNEEQLSTCLRLGFDRVYINKEDLYKEYKNEDKAYFKIPRTTYNLKKYLKEKVLTSDYFINKEITVVGDYGLNVTNMYTVYFLLLKGMKVVNLSLELTEDEIIELYNDYVNLFKEKPNLEVLVYGKPENMIIKGNILELPVNDYNYELIDTKNRKFDIYYDGEKTHILNYESRNLDITKLRDIVSIRYNFYKENEIEIKNAYKA